MRRGNCRSSPAGKDQGAYRGGRQGGVLLPAADHRRATRLFQGRGTGCDHQRFLRRLDRLRAVVGGSADVVSGAYEHTISLQGKKQFFQAFVLQGRLPQISLGVATRKGGELQIAQGSEGHEDRRVRAGLQHATIWSTRCWPRQGSSPADVSIVGVGTGAGAIAALKSGQIDAISNVDPVMTKLEQDGCDQDRRRYAHLQGHRRGMGRAAARGLPVCADRVRAARIPNTVQALTNAIVRADKWLAKATPQDILKTVPEAYLLGDKALYLFSYGKIKEAFSLDGSILGCGRQGDAEGARDIRSEDQAGRDQAGSDLYQRVREEGEREIQMTSIPEPRGAGSVARGGWPRAWMHRSRCGAALRRLTGMIPALALEHITCTFVSREDRSQRYTALKDTTLVAAEGEFVCVVGPTGCGKSTLLNVAAGLLQPSSGSVTVCGRATDRDQPPRRLSVPGRGADALAQRARQRHRRPRIPRRGARRGGRARQRLAQARGPGRFRRPLSAPAVGRHAQARIAGADLHPESARSC